MHLYDCWFFWSSKKKPSSLPNSIPTFHPAFPTVHRDKLACSGLCVPLRLFPVVENPALFPPCWLTGKLLLQMNDSFLRWMTPSSFPYVHGAESSISTDFNHFWFHLFTCLSPSQSWEGRHVPNIFLSLVLDIELAHATNSWMFVEWITELQLGRVPPEHRLCTR